MSVARLRSVVIFANYVLVLVFALVWVRFGYASRLVDANPVAFWTTYGAAVSACAARGLLALPAVSTERFASLWTALDLAIITAAVRVTGGIRSEIAILYLWPILTSSVERKPVRSITSGAACAALYVLATAPESFEPEQVGRLITRAFMLLLATSLAACYAHIERHHVEQISELRGQLALCDYRTRLAREMHDGIQHYLVSVVARLELARGLVKTDPAAAAAAAIDQRLTLRQACDELRYLVRRLRSPVVEEQGFLDALRSYVAHLSERTSASAEVQVEGEPRRLPPAVEQAAFRIIQEALTNAEKHAEATALGVLVQFADGELRGIVEDNGVGFDATVPHPASPSGGFGLDSMRQRAESVGGHAEIEGEPGRGTRVRFAIPTATHTEEAHGPHTASHR